jgi:phosphoesterase RecJ-like protein
MLMSEPDVPLAYRDKARFIATALQRLDNVIVAAHANPDGDAVGAMIAAGHILHSIGKKFVLYSGTGLPRALDFLPLPDAVHTSLDNLPFSVKGALLLDCNEPHRLGPELSGRIANFASVNVDHHPGQGMGTVANWVFPQAAATAQLVAYIALCLALPLSGTLGDAVAIGLISDTGGFFHGNTDADV